MRTRVKYCGISKPQDALLAAELGVDAVGLVFYPPSPRALDLKSAQEIVLALPPFVSIVALFLDPSAAQVTRVMERMQIDVLQFHGQESPEFCQSFGYPYIKAIGMAKPAVFEQVQQLHGSAKAFLLDSHEHGAAGGTGEAFNWAKQAPQTSKPLILAGGLRVDNVAAGIRQLKPYGVDVSSGIESARGVKDHALMRKFMNEVIGVDREFTAAGPE